MTCTPLFSSAGYEAEHGLFLLLEERQSLNRRVSIAVIGGIELIESHSAVCIRKNLQISPPMPLKLPAQKRPQIAWMRVVSISPQATSSSLSSQVLQLGDR